MKFRRPHPTSDSHRATPAVDAAAGDGSGNGGEQISGEKTSGEKTTAWWWVKTIASWTLLGVAVAALAALVVIPRVTGSTAYTVLTGSMEPKYPPGTLIVAKPTPGDQIEPGDVITFQPESGNPAVVTHRVVSVFYSADGQRQFITKGDANNATDQPLIAEQIRGKKLYAVPYLGRVNTLISGSSRSVLVFVIAGALGAYALWMWLSGLRDARRSRRADPSTDESVDETASTLAVPAASPSEAPTTVFPVVSGAAGPPNPHPPNSRPRHAAPEGARGSHFHATVSDTEITAPIPVTL